MTGMAIRKVINPFARCFSQQSVASSVIRIQDIRIQDRFVIDSLLILSFIVNSRQPSPECGSEE